MNTSFVNPYNFIPLSAKSPSRNKVERGTYSGVINYLLLTRTPLIIPNTSNDDAFRMGVKDHKSYDFFSYNDLSDKEVPVEDTFFEPVIPGSEMRGMIRSNYEILTNSCLSAVDDDDILSKRTNETFKAGLLKNTGDGSFELYEAIDCLMRTKGENSLEDDWKNDKEHWIKECYIQSGLKEGQKVYFDFVRRKGKTKPLARNVSTSNSGNKQEGYVIKGEAGPEMKDDKKQKQKHCCHIFIINKKVKKMDSIEMASLEAVLEAYKNNGEHLYAEYSREFNAFKGKTGVMFPVYYSSVNTKNEYIMLSPACITREIYKTKIMDMLKAHNTCDCKDMLCPACALFGTIVKDKKTRKVFQVSSRLRFSDLYLDAENKKKYDLNSRSVYANKVTLRPLGGPKLNNMEFYLKKPDNAWFWTYDYYVDSNGEVQSQAGEINGRKFYWHNMYPDMTNQECSKLNATVRPVSEGICFEGSIYFENITKDELDGMIYTLEAGDPDDGALEKKTHGYKLGHAKPLGFGSVAIKINSVTLANAEMNDENRTVLLTEKEYDSYTMPAFDSEITKDFAKMTDFDAVSGKNISYPTPKEAELDGTRPVFKWFVENHVGYDHRKNRKIGMPNSRTQMVYAYHMIAMNPDLQSTGYQETLGNSDRGG